MDKSKQYASINRYKQKHFKRLTIELRKDYFDHVFSPAVEKTDYSNGGFIKKCVDYVISNDIKLL